MTHRIHGLHGNWNSLLAGNRISSCSETVYRVVALFYLYVWIVKMLYHEHGCSTPLLCAKCWILGLSWFIQSCKGTRRWVASNCTVCTVLLLPFLYSLFVGWGFIMENWAGSCWMIFHDNRASIGWWLPLSSMEGRKPRSHRSCLVIWERLGEMLLKILNHENTGFKFGCMIPQHLLLHLHCLGLLATKVLAAKTIFQICQTH